MTRIFHISFYGTDSILVEEDDSLFIVPKTKEDIIKLRPHFFDQDFMLDFNNGFNLKSFAFIDRVQLEPDYHIRLYPQYIIRDSFNS